jgi:hypothetical protein
MRSLRQQVLRFGFAALLGGLALAASWAQGPAVTAQCKPGEYVLSQIGTVGWVYVSPDRSSEWWAYLDGSYRWADRTAVAEHRWNLAAEYVGAQAYPSFAAWKSAVLTRPEARGRTLVFQQHAVAEETVQN